MPISRRRCSDARGYRPWKFCAITDQGRILRSGLLGIWKKQDDILLTFLLLFIAVMVALDLIKNLVAIGRKRLVKQ